MTMSVGPSVRRAPLTIKHFTTLQSDPRHLWHLRHLIKVIRRHDLINKKTNRNIKTNIKTNTNTNTNTKTITNTFREHLQRDFLTLRQSDEKTWPDQQKDRNKDKYKYNDNDNENDKYVKIRSKGDLLYFSPLRHLIRVMRKHDLANKKTETKTKTKTLKELLQRAIIDNCNNWWMIKKHQLTNKKITRKKTTNTKTMTMTNTFTEYLQMAILELEKLGNCWHFWQLRNSKHDSHSDLTIKSDTGQHSQFCQCLF